MPVDKETTGMDPMQNNDIPELDGLKQEVLPPAGLLERAEASLFDRISQADGAEPWELYLKKDADKVEVSITSEAVTGRAEKKAFVVSLPLLFSSSSLFVAKSHIVQAAVVVALVSAAAFTGWNYFAGHYSSLQTVAVLSEHGVLQAGQRLVRESETVVTGPGQMLVLSNERGTVIVENGAGITILKARRHCMDYAIDFKEYSPASSGRVIFAVTRKKAGQEFSVATKEYVIHVVGTVFRLTPQAQGRTAVKVLEGALRIEGAGISALVSAGNTFTFNDAAGAYITGASDTGSATAHGPSSAEMKTPGRQRPEFQFRHANKGSQAPHDSLLELAVRLEAPDWKKAVETYRAVLARPGTSAYSREIALFSIGRLLSDNDAAAVEVRFAFNAYLKNFPHGTFTGESYLRLADLEYKTDPGRALVWYEKYLKELPLTQNTVAAEYKAGLILLQQNKRDRATALLTSALNHAKNYPADQVAAIQRTLDNAKNPRGDSIRNGSVKLH